MFFGVEGGFQISSTVELSMCRVVFASTNVGLANLGMLDETFSTLIFVVLIFTLVLVIDFGLDIEEGSASVLTTLAAMSLRGKCVSGSLGNKIIQ